MTVRRGFSFHVGGIEDGIVATLKEYCAAYKPDVATYSGELDAKNLREALSRLSPRFPLYLASYGQGKNTLRSKLGPEIDAPHEVRHDCNFTVICCHDNARGETERRRGDGLEIGVWEMIEDALAALSRKRFVAVVEGEKIVLNHEPLNPWSHPENNLPDVEYMIQQPDLTAYAVHFDTYFVWVTPDRREEESLVKEIKIEVFPGSGGRNLDRPGVTLD
jgi:phage gp37-like protein